MAPHQPRQRLARHHPLALPLMTTLALAAAQVGAQERSPYYIGLSETVSHDNNLYRTNTNQVTQTISTTGLVAGFDQPLGRQRVFGDATVQYNKYLDLDGLDNKSYAISTGLDWETVEFLSGQLRYYARNSLADFGSLSGSTVPSDQSTQQFRGTLRYGITSKLAIDTGYEYRRLDYSNDAYIAREYSQNSVNAGLRWGTDGLLTLGIGYRATHGSVPHFQPTPPYEDELKRHDIDLSVVWTPSALSTLNARVSSTKETHTLGSTAETSAVTGSISWNYRPTAKLRFTSLLVRDTGTETTFLSTPSSGTTALPVDRSSLSTMGQLDASYSVTSKVSFDANARQRRGTLANGGGRDKVTGYGAGLSYLPTRSTSLSCNVMRETRDAAGGSAYSATTSGCSAQITLR